MSHTPTPELQLGEKVYIANGGPMQGRTGVIDMLDHHFARAGVLVGSSRIWVDTAALYRVQS
jgi:hypothetical protein